MTTNILSKGVPMILAGDEIGNSQHGNNNAYCQDNKIGWINWKEITEKDWEFYNFIKDIIKFRLVNGKLINHDFLTPQNAKWFSPTGKEMKDTDWENSKRLTSITPDI